MIFQILKHCEQLDSVSLPWIMLSYGNVENWSRFLRPRDNRTALSSLELLAVDLKHTQITERARRMDNKPWDSPKVDFSHLRRIKLSGSSNLFPINDDDLVAISRTARLQEIHITGTTAVTTNGLMVLCRASRETLRVIEHSPLSDDGFEHPNPSAAGDNSHLCREIVQLPRLSNLAVSLPTICGNLFSEPSISWTGDVQIRAAGVCGHPGTLRESAGAQRAFFDVLAQARSLIRAQQEKNIELNIEIFISDIYLSPRTSCPSLTLARPYHFRTVKEPGAC